MMDELIGKVISGYEILQRIGEGGMATVYLARQQSMNRQVAIKVLPRHFVKDDTYMERFRREVDIASKLEHRNIIPVYDYGEYDGQPFIVMRYMPAGSLDDILLNGPLDPKTIHKILSQIAPALDYAHSKSVLHRDLKPSNVLMDDDGGAFLTDFGIARVVGDNNPGLTTQGVVGTPAYMSPEQAQGKDLDGRSDVYALGVMLFEMATGKRPFESETPYSIAVMQVTQHPPNPRTLNPAISTALETVILKAMRKSRDERYQTGINLTEAIKNAIDNPQSINDTQPRLQMASYQEILADEPTKPPSKPKNQPLAYHQSPSSASRPIVPSPSSLRSKIRKRRVQNPLIGALIGGSIGCGMLGIITAGIFLAYGLIFTGDPTPTSIADDEANILASSVATEVTRVPETLTGSEIPTLDPTNESARATLLARATNDNATEPPSDEPTPLLFPTGEAQVLPTSIEGTPVLNSLLRDVSGTIIFADERGDDDQTLEVVSINFDSGVETQLTQSPFADNMYPIASPNGNWIAFQSNREGNFEIYIVNRGGGQLQRLTFNDVTDRLPAWSPDGEWVLYSSEVEEGIFEIRRVRIDDRTDEALISNGLYNGHARYSPDGRYIVYTTGANRQDAGTWEIALLDTTTGSTTLLSNNDVRDASPVFSPDGTQILYITYNLENQSSGVAVMDIDGDNKQIIFDSDGSEWAASYSPDGQFIIFTSNATGSDELYLMTADGDGVQKFTDTGGNYASWIP